MKLRTWIKRMERAPERMERSTDVLLERVGEHVMEKARAEIGHLQPAKGPFPAWAPLKRATVRGKQREGFDFNADHNPLLRTGALRESIQKAVHGNKVTVFSDDPIAAYQEFGTEHIPPRPFISPAMFTSLPWIGARSATMVRRVLAGQSYR